MAELQGHRGYIGSRSYFGDRTPQHVQNLVVRDFCQRNGLLFLISATEYIMDGCYVMLEEVMTELPKIDGIVLYSIFMLPTDAGHRQDIYRRVLSAEVDISGAVENLRIQSEADIQTVEDIWAIKNITESDISEIKNLARIIDTE